MAGETKEVVWKLLMQPPIASFIHRRVRAYRAHEQAVREERQIVLQTPWTHVFVDECQDFTATDLQLLARVPPKPQRLCVAGDASQSIYLGRSYHRPGIAGAQWKSHHLSGSYRLPLRVCEALAPLAAEIRTWHLSARMEEDLDAVLLQSRKAAVLGFRPIVVAGETIGGGLGDLLEPYLPDPADRSVLVVDPGRQTNVLVDGDIGSTMTVQRGGMEKHKGCEWPIVIVTDERRRRTDVSETTAERLFTAMTRTTALLVIVLWPDGDPKTGALVGKLRRDRLLFWDQAAEQAFDRAAARSKSTNGTTYR